MKRVNVSRANGKFNSGAFLKVLMPRIAKNPKNSPENKPSKAPNLAVGNRTQR